MSLEKKFFLVLFFLFLVVLVLLLFCFFGGFVVLWFCGFSGLVIQCSGAGIVHVRLGGRHCN